MFGSVSSLTSFFTEQVRPMMLKVMGRKQEDPTTRKHSRDMTTPSKDEPQASSVREGTSEPLGDASPIAKSTPITEDSVGFGEPLYNPENAKVDIVFVHGLGGDRILSWTGLANEEVPVDKFWPKDFLPKACPTARILSFGYNANFVHFYPFYTSRGNVAQGTTIDDHSTTLFASLNSLRSNTGTPADRPIIFVAHSLGGLVVANALSRQHGSDEANLSLVKCTGGVIFLGTPFEGSEKARWANIALNLIKSLANTNQETVKDLQERSRMLVTINDNLYKLLNKRRDIDKDPLRVACFFEGLPTYVGGSDIGPIVPKESAKLAGRDAVLIPGNHRTMCKFNHENLSGFKNISGILKQWIQELEKKPDGAIAAASIGSHHSGDMIYHGMIRNSGVMTRDVIGNTPHANTLTGSRITTNHYGNGYNKSPTKKGKKGKGISETTEEDE